MKAGSCEIDEGSGYIGFREALDIIDANIRQLGEESLPLDQCVCRIASAEAVAQVSNPTNDVSLKDGFAVRSADVACAEKNKPVCLKMDGSAFAGAAYWGHVRDGIAIKICSGASIPDGADAVVAAEFCEELRTGEVLVKADAGVGRNIMHAGVEVEAGAVIARKGEKFLPGSLGLAAAAGLNRLKVYRQPRVTIVSVGDEVVAPGEELKAGQLYASNMVTMKSWLNYFNIPCDTSLVSDDESSIIHELEKHFPGVDAILTSGGAWGSERDLVAGALDKLGWQKLFHYVRMGPGKGVAFGLLHNVPVFCLPGGPTSNVMAFLQLALPALFRMAGQNGHPLQTVHARLEEDVKGRHHAWTEFKDAVVSVGDNGGYTASLYRNKSRLMSIARANGLLCIPEGRESLRMGDVVPVQLLRPRLDDLQG